MKLSELIAAAQEKMEKLGDVECRVYVPFYSDSYLDDVEELQEDKDDEGNVIINIL